MHSDQIYIEEALASDLIHDQFPQFRGEEIVASQSAGTVNAIFRIGSKYAARFPLRMMDPDECTSLLEAEAKASAEFNEYCPFPSPQPIGIGRQSSAYPLPWLVQTWIEGQTATPIGLSGSSTFALDLVRLITSLRVADLKGRTFDGRGRGGSLTDHEDWMEVCFSKSEDLIEVGRLRHMWEDFRKLPSPGHEVMSHKDLIPANLLVRGERLIGVLDTGAFGPADPSLDLVVGWHLLDRDNGIIFREALYADDLEWRRGAAWALQQAIGLVWYYRATNPIMSDLGRSTISRLLEDYDD
jgi:aminoglycoside phosphotransferase (APT) family kinase protein